MSFDLIIYFIFRSFKQVRKLIICIPLHIVGLASINLIGFYFWHLLADGSSFHIFFIKISLQTVSQGDVSLRVLIKSGYDR